MKSIYNYDEPVAVTRDIFRVGYQDEDSDLICNPYILVDDQEVIFIDPGSIPHFPIVMRKVIDVVNPEDISVISVSHQDPDICGNLPVVEDVINNRSLKIAASRNTIRLINHLGLTSSYCAVDENNYKLELASGGVLGFIPTSFLHAPGAVAL